MNKYKQTIANLIKLIFFIVLLIFIYIQACNIFIYPLSHYDDAVFATVSKNIAYGHGYSSSMNRASLAKFHVGIGTGPAIILPVSLSIKIFGNKYYLPGVVPAIINLLLLLFIFVALSKYKISNIKFWFSILFFLSLLLISSYFNGLELWQQFNQFYASMFGEATAVLLIIIFAILISLYNTKRKYIVYINIIAGLAIKTKLLSLLPILSIIFYISISKFKQKQDIKHLLYFYLYSIIGLFIPYICFDIYKIISFNSIQAYFDCKINELNFIYNISILESSNFITKILSNSNKLLESFGIFKFLLMLSIIIYSIYNMIFVKEKNSKYLLVHSLMFAFSCHFIWYICILCSTTGYIRFFFIAWIILLSAISFHIIVTNTKTKQIANIIFILFILFSSFNKQYINNIKLFDFSFQKREYVLAMFQVKDFITNNSQYTYCGYGWWIPWEIDFILPGINNFKNTKYDNTIYTNKIIVVNKNYYDEELRESLKNIILENKYYLLFSTD